MNFTLITEWIKTNSIKIAIYLVVFIVCYIAIQIVSGFVKKSIKKSRMDQTVAMFLFSCIKTLVYIMLVITVLSGLGVPTTTFITILGAVSLAISLAVKDFLVNITGGFMLLFTKPFVVGDTVEFSGNTGTVMKIKLFYTVVANADSKIVYIPNGSISGSKIINYSKSDIRRVEIEFSRKSGCDIEQIKTTASNTLIDNELFLTEPVPVVFVNNFTETQVFFTVRVYVLNIDYSKATQAINQLVLEAIDL